LEHIREIFAVLAELGITKVKITGGEPTIRSDIVDIVKAASDAGMEDVSMTTNGTMFADLAEALCDAGLKRVNISLDTLDSRKYRFITGASLLENVKRSICRAVELGLNPVKINMVVLKGINENEIGRMIDFARDARATLQLIELVDHTPQRGVFEKYHVDLSGLEKWLAAEAKKIIVREEMHARPKYILRDVEVEVIRPMHNTVFCANCKRIRITPDGNIKPCLLRDDNLVDISPLLGRGDYGGLKKAFLDAISYREPFFR
jgi:cyclic pyranopterin phosphate synthase